MIRIRHPQPPLGATAVRLPEIGRMEGETPLDSDSQHDGMTTILTEPRSVVENLNRVGNKPLGT